MNQSYFISLRVSGGISSKLLNRVLPAVYAILIPISPIARIFRSRSRRNVCGQTSDPNSYYIMQFRHDCYFDIESSQWQSITYINNKHIRMDSTDGYLRFEHGNVLRCYYSCNAKYDRWEQWPSHTPLSLLHEPILITRQILQQTLLYPFDTWILQPFLFVKALLDHRPPYHRWQHVIVYIWILIESRARMKNNKKTEKDITTYLSNGPREHCDK